MTEPYVTDEEWLTRKVASISWNMKEPSYAAQLKPRHLNTPRPFVHAPGERPCFANILPAELLLKVFCYLPWDRDCLATNKLPWNWVDITRVCKLWRDTVYLSAEFWTRIPLQTIRTVARSLQLSGDMPLRLFADFKIPWKTRDALALALASLPRITELSITGTTVLSCNWHYVARCLSARPATNLRRLTMHFADELGDGYGDIPGYTIFNCSPAPVLQELELRGFALPWVDECSMFLVPSLTSLILLSCDLQFHWSTIENEEDDVDPGTETIFDALCNLPLLQVLVIDDCRLPVDLDSEDEFTPPKKPLAFPHLRKLTLHGNVRMVTRLLDNMVVPPSTSLNLWYFHVRDVAAVDPVIDMAKAVSFFDRHFNAAAANGAFYSHTHMMYDTGDDSYSDDPLRRVTFEYRDPKQTGAVPLPEETTIKHLWTKQLDIFIREYWEFAESFYKTIPCDTENAYVHITQLGTLNFHHMYIAYDHWYDSILRVSQVKSVRLTNNAVDVCALLLRSTKSLPALNSLELEGCHLDGHEQELEELLQQRAALSIYTTDCTGVERTRLRLEDNFRDRVHWEQVGSIQG